MAKTFVVAPSMRAARDWCRDNSQQINAVEVITHPTQALGYQIVGADQIILIEPVNRHTSRAFDMLQASRHD